MAYEMLLSPIKIGNMQLKNRVVMAPMLIGMGDFDGKPTEQLMNYYVERAKGGTALIITDARQRFSRRGGVRATFDEQRFAYRTYA